MEAKEAPEPGITFKGSLVPTSSSIGLLKCFTTSPIVLRPGDQMLRAVALGWGEDFEDLSHKPGTAFSTEEMALCNAYERILLLDTRADWLPGGDCSLGRIESDCGWCFPHHGH